MCPYSSAGGFGLFADIVDIRRFELHAVGGLHGFEAAVEKCVVAERFVEAAIHGRQRVHFAPLLGRAEPLIVQIGDHLIRLDFGVVERYALVLGGQKAGAPERRTTAASAGREYDERGQILVFRAEPIGNPRAERRPVREDAARVNKAARGHVRGVERIHGADDADIVDHARHARQQFAEFDSALARLLEFEGRGQQPAGLALGAEIDGIGALALMLEERGLGSNISSCEGPPAMNRKMMFLAFTGRWGLRSGRKRRLRRSVPPGAR